jgi:hypothetical protein
MVTLLQAYGQIGDAEAVVTAQLRSALAVGAWIGQSILGMMTANP